MKLKIKLALIFSLIVTVILVLNNTLYYYSTRDQLRKDQEKQMESIAKEIGISIEHSQYGSQYVENLIGEELRTASVAAKYALDPDIHNVTNEQLTELSRRIGISHITLFQKVNNDIVGMKSSDPREINLSTKEWGFWYQAFQQLFSKQEVTIPEGQKLPHFWSGPIDVSSSDPSHVDKWGYYYDGTTNYMIDPYVRDDYLKNFEQLTGPEAILDKTLKNNSTLLEITGFNPKAFGKEPIYTRSNGENIISLQNRPIFFGNYSYTDSARDVSSVKQAIDTGGIVNFETTVNGKHVIKSFIPVKAELPYVIGLVTDYSVIQSVLNKQLLYNLVISLILLLVVFLGSFFYAGYIVRPIQSILKKVNEIAEGNFGVQVEIHRKDELGRLADRVNVMSKNLQGYTRELTDKQEQIQHQAYRDPLTELPNRRFFSEHLNSALANHQTLAILFLDLDRFKNINDTLGHTFGDRVLQAVAQSLSKCIATEDIVARIGGDEFILLLQGVGQAEHVIQIAQKVLDNFKNPLLIDQQEIHLTPSIGISVAPVDGTDPDTLIKRADTALYYAKENGRNHYEFYQPEMESHAVERLTLENELRKAVQHMEFQLYFQPKVNLQSGQINGVESLIRWNHSKLGMISPTRFIPIAEETGMIIPLGEWILSEACKQNKRWQLAGYPPLRMAVNLSARQFQERNLVELITRILEETGLDPHWLEIEITESTLMYNTEDTVSKLKQLQEMGIHVTIDDFGTGYSSLSYLKKFPINTLKIDKSFIHDLIHDADDRAIVTAIISMSHNLKLNVNAEGVETEEQLIFLKDNGCHEMQGFWFSKPVPAEALENLLRGQQEAAGGQADES